MQRHGWAGLKATSPAGAVVQLAPAHVFSPVLRLTVESTGTAGVREGKKEKKEKKEKEEKKEEKEKEDRSQPESHERLLVAKASIAPPAPSSGSQPGGPKTVASGGGGRCECCRRMPYFATFGPPRSLSASGLTNAKVAFVRGSCSGLRYLVSGNSCCCDDHLFWSGAGTPAAHRHQSPCGAPAKSGHRRGANGSRIL